MKLNKYFSTWLGLAGLGTWLILAPLVIVPTGRQPTANRILDVRNQAVNVITREGSGSGVIFHKHGLTYVLTAGHVVGETPYHGECKVTQGQKSWTAVVVNCDTDRDLALLRLTVDYTVQRSAHLAKKKAHFPVGTRVLHVGNLLGEFSDSYLEGVLSAERGEVSQSSVLAWPGSSGGGLWTTDGQLIGILTRGAAGGLNFFIPHNLIWRWAVENDLQWLFL